jgi:hypothetical protein
MLYYLNMNNTKLAYLLVIVILALVAVLGIGYFGNTRNNHEIFSVRPLAPSVVSTGTISCPGIRMTYPLATTSPATVTFPLTLSGIVHPTGTKPGEWIVFEGEAGVLRMIDHYGKELIPYPILLDLDDDWMNLDPKPFSVTIPTLIAYPANGIIDVVLTDNDASGENTHECSGNLNLAS